MATTLHSPISVGERIVWNFINVGHFDCLVGLEIKWVQDSGSFLEESALGLDLDLLITPSSCIDYMFHILGEMG